MRAETNWSTPSWPSTNPNAAGHSSRDSDPVRLVAETAERCAESCIRSAEDCLHHRESGALTPLARRCIDCGHLCTALVSLLTSGAGDAALARDAAAECARGCRRLLDEAPQWQSILCMVDLGRHLAACRAACDELALHLGYAPARRECEAARERGN